MAYQWDDYQKDIKREHEANKDLYNSIHKATGLPIEQARKFRRTSPLPFGDRHHNGLKVNLQGARDAESKKFQRSVNKLKSIRKKKA